MEDEPRASRRRVIGPLTTSRRARANGDDQTEHAGADTGRRATFRARPATLGGPGVTEIQTMVR